MTLLLEAPNVAKKPVEDDPKPKRYGTMIRVPDEFAEAIGEAASFEKLSIGDYAMKFLLPVIADQYREAVTKKAKHLGGK